VRHVDDKNDVEVYLFPHPQILHEVFRSLKITKIDSARDVDLSRKIPAQSEKVK